MYTINKEGWEYYNELRSNAGKFFFIAGPLLIIFFIVIMVGILGWTIYTWYILIFPLSLTTLGCYFSPLVLRGKYVNSLITKLKLNDNTITIETFGWFIYPSQLLTVDKFNITVLQNSGDLQRFPANCKLKLNKSGRVYNLYLIRDFYDNWDELIDKIHSTKS
jgi:hypothetical protein